MERKNIQLNKAEEPKVVDCTKIDSWRLETYKIYREKVTHEDSLINFRTSWFVTLQSFLFISFSLTAGNVKGLGGLLLTIILSYVGINVCKTTLIGVQAASQAIDITWKQWESKKSDIDPHGILPALKGGLSRPDGPISNDGSHSSLRLPKYLRLAWFAILGFSVFKYIASLVTP